MEMQAPLRQQESANWEFFLSLPEFDRERISHTQVKDTQLLEPLFEFSGACAGKFEERLEKRSEEHTSELQSRLHLGCRPLLVKKTSHRLTSGSTIRQQASKIRRLSVCSASTAPLPIPQTL